MLPEVGVVWAWPQGGQDGQSLPGTHRKGHNPKEDFARLGHDTSGPKAQMGWAVGARKKIAVPEDMASELRVLRGTVP